MILYHAANIFTSTNRNDSERMGRAQKTWWQLYGASGSLVRPAHSKNYRRSALDLGDVRSVPFIKDVIEVAVKEASLDDAIMLTNADSSLCQKADSFIFQGLYDQGCCFSTRRDMLKIHRTWLPQEDVVRRGEKFIGVDLVAFTVKWWKEHGPGYPDLLLGYEGWDWVFKFMIGNEIPTVVYHEVHQEPYWHRHRMTAPGNQWNRAKSLEWAEGRADKDRIWAEWPSLKTYKAKMIGVKNPYQEQK